MDLTTALVGGGLIAALAGAFGYVAGYAARARKYK